MLLFECIAVGTVVISIFIIASAVKEQTDEQIAGTRHRVWLAVGGAQGTVTLYLLGIAEWAFTTARLVVVRIECGINDVHFVSHPDLVDSFLPSLHSVSTVPSLLSEEDALDVQAHTSTPPP